MTLPIKTQYFVGTDQTQVNSSKDANRAVATCVYHMQINHYGADVAHVYDDHTGELHAEVKRWKAGDVHITYKRDPLKHERRFAPGALAAAAAVKGNSK